MSASNLAGKCNYGLRAAPPLPPPPPPRCPTLPHHHQCRADGSLATCSLGGKASAAPGWDTVCLRKRGQTICLGDLAPCRPAATGVAADRTAIKRRRQLVRRGALHLSYLALAGRRLIAPPPTPPPPPPPPHLLAIEIQNAGRFLARRRPALGR